MILFRPEHVRPILEGIVCPECGGQDAQCEYCEGTGRILKTETRRFWKTMRVRVGSIQKLYCGGLPMSKCKMCGGLGHSAEPVEFDGEKPIYVMCPDCRGSGHLQPFAEAKVLEVYEQELRDMTMGNIYREGYTSIDDYRQALMKINHKRWVDDCTEIAVVRFELTPEFAPFPSKPIAKRSAS